MLVSIQRVSFGVDIREDSKELDNCLAPLMRRYRCFSTHASSLEKLIVFDTTLRDGEQSPGATLNFREKVDIARGLSSLGVDVCEAGFPIASPGDFDAVSAIAQEVGPLELNRSHGPMCIAGLARATEQDIQRCYDAVKHAWAIIRTWRRGYADRYRKKRL